MLSLLLLFIGLRSQYLFIELTVMREETGFELLPSVDLLRLDVLRVRRLESLLTLQVQLLAWTGNLLFYLVISYNLVLWAATGLLLVFTLLGTGIKVFLDGFGHLGQLPVVIGGRRSL
jgi:hypothetical protein